MNAGSTRRSSRALGPAHYVPGRPSARARGRRTPLIAGPTVRRTLLGLLGVAVVAQVVLFCLTSPVLAVRRVRVFGLDAATPEEAAQAGRAAAVPARTNLLRAPTAQMTRTLERLPWVAHADVSRRFPPGLAVEITPRRPVASVIAGGPSWEVDGGGVVIRRARPGLGLPEIRLAGAVRVSPGAAVDASGLLGAIQAARFAGDLAPVRVSKIAVDQSGELCLNMMDSIVIRLGQEEGLSTKLALVRRMYQVDTAIARKVVAIDLRCPERPACTPRSAGSASSQNAVPVSSLHDVNPMRASRAGPRGTVGRSGER